MILLSHYQTRPLLAQREAGLAHAETSLDLGLTTAEVVIESSGVAFSNGERLSWPVIEEICQSENNCYEVQDGKVHKLMTFSESTDRVISLMPTAGAPTILISGIPMHRIKGIDPHQDTLQKIGTIKPLHGQVLDTATGLGYTAIEAARTADRVITVELDPTVLEIARVNPWSQSLFDNPRITRLLGDSYDLLDTFEGQVV